MLKMAEDLWSPIAHVYDPLMAGSIDGTDDVAHDHGIVRALSCKYKTNKQVAGDPSRTIFASRLNPKTDENSLRKCFSEYGQIKQLRLVRDIVTGFTRGYGFIEYEEEYSARKAFVQANKSLLDGSEIFVDFERERILKNWVPRRLGGGFGGNKESGQLRFGGRDRPFKKPIIVNSDSNSGYKKWDYKDSSHQKNRDFQHKDGRFGSERGGNYSRSDSREFRDRGDRGGNSERSYRSRERGRESLESKYRDRGYRNEERRNR
ncbi:U11/U12 small nuclear ribonucleoprotein 35 kDa protein-like isoform X1 [Octopus sinensis]|nr:U11/U12 small nuclear ribonucleoprotein 35 kDa protein-like isoform X1 [Octopus sinensis]